MNNCSKPSNAPLFLCLIKDNFPCTGGEIKRKDPPNAVAIAWWPQQPPNIGILGAAINQRLRKLDSQNLIIGSSIIVNTKLLGFTTMAFIGIFLDKATNNKTVVNQLIEIPEILECHYTTGDWSVLAKLICKDNEDLMEILTKKIQTIQGVSRTETYISLEQQINRQISL